MADYLSKKVDFAKALKGSEVETRLRAAVASGDAPKTVYADTLAKLAAACERTGSVSVGDVQNLPAKVGQLPFSGHGADIYLVVSCVNEFYQSEGAVKAAAPKADPKK